MHSKRREPWLFDEWTNKRIKSSIQQRYTFLPYWYSLFYEHEVSGVAPMRPLWMEYPREAETFAIEDQHLVGDGLLVKPVVQPGVNDIQVYLPGGAECLWYDIATYEAHPGAGYRQFAVTIESIPVLQRGGSIIPKKERARRSSTRMAKDPYTLVVALDRQGEAKGRLYVDDFQSLDYQKGQYRLIEYTMSNKVLSSR